ncbi:hypothetical protein J2X72_004359 [Phyllobacterium sp. 1468]|uniref:Holotricin-3 precursor n=1 Tax=Phyllobacterium sp. 1468 TaxID=2817759 RepID=UPI001AE6F853|nr:Holotricin-3 precursor [Phyllobacterium sp. 1468]MDR6635545.1 hypothetical protein [Phyllobacterium sp. 1468]
MVKIKKGLVTAACLGLFVAGIAFPIDYSGSIGASWAKDGGNGKGGGEGNGKGGGAGNSGGNHGKSSNHGSSANAHDKSKVDKATVDSDDNNDDSLGALNAAHASARARERAAPNSAVGKIATYERSRDEAMALTDPALREQALEDAVEQLETAFGRTLTADQIDRIDDLLDARQ